MDHADDLFAADFSANDPLGGKGLYRHSTCLIAPFLVQLSGSSKVAFCPSKLSTVHNTPGRNLEKAGSTERPI